MIRHACSPCFGKSSILKMVRKWTLFSLFSRLQSLSPSGERLPGIVPNVAVHILTYAQVELKLFKITVQVD